MANRFTDTDKWEDPWFQKLSSDYKMAWLFICDKCNHAGVWKINMDLLNYYVSPTKPITKESMLSAFNNGKQRIIPCNSTRFFVSGFIMFQYKVGLNPKNNAHLGVIKELKKHQLIKHLPRGYVGADQGLARGPGNGIGIGKGKGNKEIDPKIIETADKVIDYFNTVTNSFYKHSDTARGPIVARLKDGFTGKQCAEVIHKKYHQWKDDDKMCKFIRIETLFRPTKFEGYVNEKSVSEPEKRWL